MIAAALAVVLGSTLPVEPAGATNAQPPGTHGLSPVHGGGAGAFDHEAHGRAAPMACDGCHVEIAASVRATERDAPTPARCAACHPGGPTWLAGPRVAPALIFSHRAHLARGATCASCHGEGPIRLPSMGECLSCHDGQAAPARCETCHPAGPDGRLRTELPGGRLQPTGRFGDFDHRGDVLARHGAPAKVERAACATCHDEPSCARCHAATARPVEVHAADYVLTHAPEARRDDPTCGGCHHTATFCVDCHARSGFGTMPGRPGAFTGGPGRTDAFHPAGWVDTLGETVGANHHRWEARRNLRACVSCHEEASCVRCHGVETTARLRSSPHPPGFRTQCRLRDVNERGCLTCHGSREALVRVCK